MSPSKPGWLWFILFLLLLDVAVFQLLGSSGEWVGKRTQTKLFFIYLKIQWICEGHKMLPIMNSGYPWMVFILVNCYILWKMENGIHISGFGLVSLSWILRLLLIPVLPFSLWVYSWGMGFQNFTTHYVKKSILSDI